VFLSMASYSSSFSQVLDANCVFIVPEDTSGIIIRDFEYTTEVDFPNWSYKPFYLRGKYKYDSTVGNKIEIILDSASFLNPYTGDVATVGGIHLSGTTGIDTKSMREFAKEVYRKKLLEEWIKTIEPAPQGCHEGRDTFTFSFITKKDCFQKRICRFRLGELVCCSNSDDQVIFQDYPDGYNVIDHLGEKYLLITRTIPCNTISCCEERYHYVCDPFANEPNNTWTFSHKDYSTYIGIGCGSPPFPPNYNCNFSEYSSCKSGCGND
jgi:hypothetical protein